MLDRLPKSSGSVKSRQRVGRGASSKGKTSGRGHKGQGARAGRGVSLWFEGGQTPMKMRIPKRGFKNRFKTLYDIVNVGALGRFEDGSTVDAGALLQNNLITGKRKVKILGNGNLGKKLVLKVNSASDASIREIERSGGRVEIL